MQHHLNAAITRDTWYKYRTCIPAQVTARWRPLIVTQPSACIFFYRAAQAVMPALHLGAIAYTSGLPRRYRTHDYLAILVAASSASEAHTLSLPLHLCSSVEHGFGDTTLLLGPLQVAPVLVRDLVHTTAPCLVLRAMMSARYTVKRQTAAASEATAAVSLTFASARPPRYPPPVHRGRGVSACCCPFRRAAASVLSAQTRAGTLRERQCWARRHRI